MDDDYKLRVAQKTLLFTLCRLKKRNPDIVIKGLDGDIIATEALMEQGDVALIRKKITELPE